MNDVKDLLQRALSDERGADAMVDPAADLARGRRLLHRRRSATLAGATAAVLVAGLTPVALAGFGGNSTQPQAVPAPRSNSSAPSAPTKPSKPVTKGTLNSIDLVAYHGTQPQGYKVTWMPAGWVIQGGNPTALVIAPKHAKDKSPDTFVGKLVVLSASEGEQHEGTSQKVDGREGYLSVQGDVQVLQYKAATGRWVVIQAPTSLGWDGDQIAKFATGVKVLKTAQTGLG